MKKIFLILIIVMIFLLTSCGYKNSVPVEKEEFHMGTVITEKVYGENAETAAAAVMDRISRIEATMTINAAGSEIDKLNDAAGRNEVKLSPDSMYVLQKAIKYAQLSDGCFDVTIGPLVKAWGVFTDHPRVPDKSEINYLLGLINYKDIYIDKENSSARLAREKQIVDLGGIAKGYAGDESVKLFEKYGIKSALVNLGGNVVVHGAKPDGSPWSVGIQNPRDTNGKYIGIIHVTDKAVVTSGDYERFFEKDGIRYHHILDPRTGYPADSGLISSTIIADSSIDADALSTSTFILGLDKGMKLVESLKGVEAIFITNDKKIYITPGLKGNFEFNKESKDFIYVEKG